MRRAPAVLAVAVVCLSACGDPGAPRYTGSSPPEAQAFGTCAFCHPEEASGVLPVAATLTCVTCHAEARPGFAGPGHRKIPGPDLVPSYPATGHWLGGQETFGSCSFCHSSTASRLVAFRGLIRCETCHKAAFTTGFGPRHRSLPDSAVVPDPPRDPHAPGAEALWKHCALCHNEAARDMQDLLGLPRAIVCETCHTERTPGEFGAGHAALPTSAVVPNPPSNPHRPGPERGWGSCALCHNDVAQDLQETGFSQRDIACTTCHSELTPGRFGAGHYSVPTEATVPSKPARAHRPAAERSWGTCALCHNEQARSLESVLGPPGEVSCESCHVDVDPGQFGPGHRQRPDRALVPDPPADPHRPRFDAAASGSCAFCHAKLAGNVAPVASELACEVCHADVTPKSFGPGHRRPPSVELVPAFVGADHALGRWQSFGVCVFCHRDTVESVDASGAGELGCLTCHTAELANFGPGHRSLPGPDLVPSFVGAEHFSGARRAFGTCSFCHRATVDRALQWSHGSLAVECEQCHAQGEVPEFGKGHRTVTACIDCHGTLRKTHQDSAVGTPYECGNCHDPHGSRNLFLVRELILTPLGELRPVRLENLRGRDDAGFTSVSQPGSGLCEVCHTNTRFFRADGSGESHFGFPCFTCHPHALGFSVRP